MVSNKVALSILILMLSNAFMLGLALYEKSQIPTTINKEFKILSYSVPQPFTKGHLHFIIKCLNTGLEKEYYINEGRLYFSQYVNNDTLKWQNSGAWVGGLSCTAPE